MSQVKIETTDNPQPHQHAEIIKAWADGREIQYRNTKSYIEEWTTPANWNRVNPVDQPHCEWRIKPEAKTGWINIYQYDGFTGVSDQTYATKESALKHCLQNNKNVKHLAIIQISYTPGEGLVQEKNTTNDEGYF